MSQGVHRIKFTVASCLGVPKDRVRVITGDVGGGFGVRSSVYPEYALLAWASRRIGLPVKWNSSRTEAFLADFQARDVWVEGALALDHDGKFLALQLHYTGNLGAYPVSYAVLNNVTRMAAGVYDIPAIHVRVTGVATNTVPMSVYRGAGRPESNFMMERLADLAARELGIERAELRRRNIIPASALPYQSPLGHRYDSGAFAENLASVLRLIDWDGFPRGARRRKSAACGAASASPIISKRPTGFVDERTDIRVLPEGRVEAAIGTQASGQGHETSFAQIVAEKLGLQLDEVAILFGDTAVSVSGGGTHSDRSMRLGSAILVEASQTIIERGRKSGGTSSRSRRKRYRLCRRPLHRHRNRSGGDALRGGFDRSDSQDARGAARAARRHRDRRYGGCMPIPMAQPPARSRSTRARHRAASCATPPPTMSAASSIR